MNIMMDKTITKGWLETRVEETRNTYRYR